MSYILNIWKIVRPLIKSKGNVFEFHKALLFTDELKAKNSPLNPHNVLTRIYLKTP